MQRDFTGDGPNKLWVTDITEHPTREGKVFCHAVLDAFSRLVDRLDPDRDAGHQKPWGWQSETGNWTDVVSQAA